MHGHAPRGERCQRRKNWNPGNRVNVIGRLLAGVPIAFGITQSNVDAI